VDAFAVQPHQAADERKADADSTLCAIECPGVLSEQIEHLRQHLLWNANAGVPHADDRL
jgi:hypothetical protein